jgi:predicted thioesterase
LLDDVAPGLTETVSIVVGHDDTAIAMGSGDVEVLATPRIVALVEAAAVATLAGRLPDSHTSVGTHVSLDHLAPSPIGAEVTARATVTAVDDRRVTFAVEAHMSETLIAHGEHVRAVVRRAGFGS